VTDMRAAVGVVNGSGDEIFHDAIEKGAGSSLYGFRNPRDERDRFPIIASIPQSVLAVRLFGDLAAPG
jgi:hypothetical protein